MEKKQYDARSISIIGLLIALHLILTHFLAIQTPVVRISFGFVPAAMLGMLFGPWTAGIAGILSDLAGTVLLGGSGVFFPGFILSAFLGNFFFGLFLYQKPKTWKRIILAVVVITVFVNLGLNTLWIVMLYDQAARAIIPARLLQNLIVAPIQIIIVYFIANNNQLKNVMRLDQDRKVKK